MKNISNQQMYDRFADADQDDLDDAFIRACEKGNIRLAQYLLMSQDLPQHADIHAEEDAGFTYACRTGNLELVKYLAASGDLSEHADIYSLDCDAFNLACDNNHWHVVEYLIFDLKINQTQAIIEHIQYNEHTQAEKMFALRTLNAQLQADLPLQNTAVAKRKI